MAADALSSYTVNDFLTGDFTLFYLLVVFYLLNLIAADRLGGSFRDGQPGRSLLPSVRRELRVRRLPR